MLTFAIVGAAGIALWLLAEVVAPAAFGYIGAGAVWLVTLGHIRMEPLTRGESELASQIGLLLVLALIVAGYVFFRIA